MTALLICCLASGCWLGTGWALDRWELYPEHWFATAYAGLMSLLAFLVGSHR